MLLIVWYVSDLFLREWHLVPVAGEINQSAQDQPDRPSQQQFHPILPSIKLFELSWQLIWLLDELSDLKKTDLHVLGFILLDMRSSQYQLLIDARLFKKMCTHAVGEDGCAGEKQGDDGFRQHLGAQIDSLKLKR